VRVSDAFIRVWDARTAQCTTSFQLGEVRACVHSVSFTHDMCLVLSVVIAIQASDAVKATSAIESIVVLKQQTHILVCNRRSVWDSTQVVSVDNARFTAQPCICAR
jgi:hypothetical protein